MCKFIKVTPKNRKPIIIGIGTGVSIKENEEYGGAIIHQPGATNIDRLRVEETYEEVKDMLGLGEQG